MTPACPCSTLQASRVALGLMDAETPYAPRDGNHASCIQLRPQLSSRPSQPGARDMRSRKLHRASPCTLRQPAPVPFPRQASNVSPSPKNDTSTDHHENIQESILPGPHTRQRRGSPGRVAASQDVSAQVRYVPPVFTEETVGCGGGPTRGVGRGLTASGRLVPAMFVLASTYPHGGTA